MKKFDWIVIGLSGFSIYLLCLCGCQTNQPSPVILPPAPSGFHIESVIPQPSMTATAYYAPASNGWNLRTSSAFVQVSPALLPLDWTTVSFPYPTNGGDVSVIFTNAVPPMFMRAGYVLDGLTNLTLTN